MSPTYSDVKTSIGSTNFYYSKGAGYPGNGVFTLSSSVFLLSLTELGFDYEYANTEGAALPIASTLQIAYNNGSAVDQWTRSPHIESSTYVGKVYASGNDGDSDARNELGVRPCFTLPEDVLVRSDNTIDVSYLTSSAAE